MDVLSRLAAAGIVPVVVLDKAEDAVPTARAMLAGGIDVMEITFRTAAAADSIRAVSKEVPEMLVGAGTVINLEQCKLAVRQGAKFIVSPGYDDETVAWCVENDIAVTPGCVTPTEIMMATGTEKAKGNYYAFSKTVSETNTVDTDELDRIWLAVASSAAHEAGLPDYVDVVLKTTATALKEADATEFISTNTKDTVRFTKPRRTE